MELREPLKTPKGDRSSVVGLVQPWELFAKRQLPRIAVNSKGKIFLIEVAEIVAVHSQGNYASVRCRSSLYLLRETLGSIAVKLKPYGFIQIHRSVLVNALLVDEVWPLSTGEYGLRLRNGGEYVVTRRYRDNLKHLAYVWLGSERVFSSARMELYGGSNFGWGIGNASEPRWCLKPMSRCGTAPSSPETVVRLFINSAAPVARYFSCSCTMNLRRSP